MGWAQDPLLWWTSPSGLWQSPALEVVILQLSELWVTAMSPAP